MLSLRVNLEKSRSLGMLPFTLEYRYLKMMFPGLRFFRSWVPTLAAVFLLLTRRLLKPASTLRALIFSRGMTPFQNAYLMIFALMFSILAGNHALVRLESYPVLPY